MRYQHQVVIVSPVSRVFAFMDDVAQEARWQRAIIDATKDPSGATQVGTRKRYVSQFMGRRIENTYVTKAFETDTRVVYETTPDSTLRAEVELTFEPLESGTRVTMSVEGKPTGPLRFIPSGLLEGVFRSELEASMKRLKEILEDRP